MYASISKLEKCVRLLRLSAALMLTAAIPAFAIPSVWTEHNDVGRTGQNLSETILTPANVTSTTFGQLFHYTLDDEAYGQVLYVPGLTMAVDGASHNVAFVATVNNSVYAFDADSGTANGGNPLWHVNLTASGARPVANTDASAFGACGSAYGDFQGKMGIVGAPVIDTLTNTLYVASKDINGSTWTARLHALDCTSGAEKFGGPVVMSGSHAGTNFTPEFNNQRPALTLVNGIVYVAFSSYCDTGPYWGYVLAYNKTNLAQTAAWSSTNSSGGQGGIWQGGQGLTADASNNLYLMTGNGTWDGNGNYGESFVKLSGSLTLDDYFTPSNYATLNGADTDLGAAGCLQIPGTNYIFGGGKQGMVYLVNDTNMGHENGTDQVVQEFQATFPQNGDTGHIHGGPVYFNSGGAQYVYLWGENDFCRAFQFNGSSFTSTAVATSTMRAPVSNSGMPGGFLSISANGTSNGIVWANTPYNGDANHGTVAGILHAFNATAFSGGALTELWNSQMNATRDSYGNFSKNTYPTIVNGKVYVGTFGTATSGSGSLYVYGNISGGGTTGTTTGTTTGSTGTTTGGSAPIANGTYTLTPSCATGSRLDASGGGTTNGTAVQIWTSAGNSNQNWIVTNTGSGIYKIATANNSGVVLNVSGAGTTNGTPVQLWLDDGTNASRWTITGSSPYTLIPANATGDALDVPGAGTANGLQMEIYAANNTNAQQWTFTSVGASCTATPAAPGTPTASGTTSTTTNLRPGAVTAPANCTITGYEIYKNGTALAASTTTSYAVTGLTASTNYQFTVAAIDSDGTGAQSAAVSVTTSAASGGEGPYNGTVAAIPGTVQAENYDTGGQGVGYSVTAVNGTANTYRSDGVDLEVCTDTGGGYNVGWTGAGQWFRYTVNVATAGTYTVACRVSDGATAAGTFHIQNSAGTNLSGAINVAVTGGWQTWTTVNATVTLPAGQQVLTVSQDSANFNINYLTFTANGASCTTKPSAPATPTASGTTSTGTNLAWGAVTPPTNCTITGYEVYKNGTALASSTTTSYAVTGLTASTAYQFTVAAIDAAGTGTASGAVSVTTSASGGACTGIAAWSPNSVAYAVGNLVTYNGSEYKCLQAHTSQAAWDPVDAPSLWSLVGSC